MYDDTLIHRVRDDGPCMCVVVHSARARYDLVETLKSFLEVSIAFKPGRVATCKRVLCNPPPPQCIQLVNPLGNILWWNTGKWFATSHTEHGGLGKSGTECNIEPGHSSITEILPSGSDEDSRDRSHIVTTNNDAPCEAWPQKARERGAYRRRKILRSSRLSTAFCRVSINAVRPQRNRS